MGEGAPERASRAPYGNQPRGRVVQARERKWTWLFSKGDVHIFGPGGRQLEV